MFKKDNENENITEHDTEIEDIEESVENKIKQLKSKLKECEKEKGEYLDGWQRSKAELINFKKDIESSKKDFVLFANENLMQELVFVLDSFDMAFSNTEQWNKIDEKWRKGVEYINTQLITILKNSGLEIINPKKEKFNPKFHDSVEFVDTDKKEEDNLILEVLQNGYNLNNKNIRPAKVKIAVYKGH